MPYFKAHCHDTLTFDATRFHVDVSMHCSMPPLCRPCAALVPCTYNPTCHTVGERCGAGINRCFYTRDGGGGGAAPAGRRACVSDPVCVALPYLSGTGELTMKSRVERRIGLKGAEWRARWQVYCLVCFRYCLARSGVGTTMVTCRWWMLARTSPSTGMWDGGRVALS